MTAHIEKRLAICWPHFGPYHFARLDALSKALADDWHLCGFETDPSDSTYEWSCEENQNREWTHVKSPPTLVSHSLASYRPTIVFINGWGFPTSRRVWRWCLRNRTPKVLLSDSRASDKKRNRISEWAKSAYVKTFQAAVTAGESHAEYLVSLGMPRHKIHLGLDVVDNQYFSSRRSDHSSNTGHFSQTKDRPYFLGIGRWIKKKDWPLLIRAYATWSSSIDNPPELRLVGGGEMHRELNKMRLKYQLNENLSLVPFQSYATLPNLYQNAIATVLPSREDEQWGLVVNESLAAGTPVIVSTECGCTESLVEHEKTGFIFQAGDEHSLRRMLQKVYFLPSSSRKEVVRLGSSKIDSWGLPRFASAIKESVTTCLLPEG